jgi:hypothetical protein
MRKKGLVAMDKYKKAQYHTLMVIITGVLSDWDPYALLAGGAPSDEFHPEAAKIALRVGKIGSASEAAVAISEVFSSAFSEPELFTPYACKDAGEKLFMALKTGGFIERSAA